MDHRAKGGYITAAQAAITLNVSRKTIYAMVKFGTLEGLRVGRKVNVSCQSVNAFIAFHTTRPPQVSKAMLSVSRLTAFRFLPPK